MEFLDSAPDYISRLREGIARLKKANMRLVEDTQALRNQVKASEQLNLTLSSRISKFKSADSELDEAKKQEDQLGEDEPLDEVEGTREKAASSQIVFDGPPKSGARGV